MAVNNPDKNLWLHRASNLVRGRNNNKSANRKTVWKVGGGLAVQFTIG